ncbi:MAG: FtsX-like permease family protein, partial [Lachnospiraceae bacterium]
MENGQISSVQMIQSVSVRAQDLVFRFRDKQMLRTFQTETITGLVSDYSTFSQAKVDYLQGEIKDFEKMVAGREFQTGDKSAVILSERTVFELGFLNPDEIIGQKLEIDLGGKVFDIKIIGVAAAQLCDENRVTESERQRLSDSKEKENEVFLPEMEYNGAEEAAFAMKGYFSADVVEEIENNRMDADGIRTFIHISVDKAKDTLGIIRDINQMLGNEFFLSGNLLQLFSVMETIKKGTNVMILLSLILVLLTLLNLYCVLYMVSDKQKKSFALKNVLGFSKKKICNMYCMEIWMATGIASFLSLILGFFVCKAADMIV